jgi:hypothetical protein
MTKEDARTVGFEKLKGNKLRLRQHQPDKEYGLDRKLIAYMYRVWDDCVR